MDYDENEHNQFITQDCNSSSYRLGNIEENVSGSDRESHLWQWDEESEAEHNSNISEPLENEIVDYNELVD